ncbi:hypothetical protein [Paenibacillus sp. YAF4_2]|uniref:hypothetical protein n=1 Tax=Paenibacillus sp. YAF4_2 TaxID=3233085 RepID=UPI003F9AC307
MHLEFTPSQACSTGDYINQFEKVMMEKVTSFENRFVIELTIDGRHTVMLIPVILLNGNLSAGRY